MPSPSSERRPEASEDDGFTDDFNHQRAQAAAMTKADKLRLAKKLCNREFRRGKVMILGVWCQWKVYA